MARKFCTLEEAASRLSTSEDQLKAMLAEGLLQEFRDGTGHFLRSADVQALVLKQSRGGGTATMAPPAVESADEPTEEDVLAWRRERPKAVVPDSDMSVDNVTKPHVKTSRKPKRPGLRSWRMSRRQGLWAGVLDDRPSAILAVFILAALFIGGLAAGAYFLLQRL